MNYYSNKLFVILFIVFSFAVNAQNSVIKSLDIKSENNNLMVYPHFKDFFDENIQSVISSGMSKTFHIYCELSIVNGKRLTGTDEVIKIRNDVWEKKYQIKFAKNHKHFTEYDHFKIFLLDSLFFNLGSIKFLPKKDKLQIFTTFSSENISTTQKEKLQYWLTSENKSKNENQGSSFSVNISKLISFFFSDKDSKDLHIYKSKIFTIQSVIENAEIPQ